MFQLPADMFHLKNVADILSFNWLLPLQEADEELKKVAPSYTKATICESTLKVIAEAIAALREEMRSLSSMDASASSGLVTSPTAPATGGQKGATGIDRVRLLTFCGLSLPPT